MFLLLIAVAFTLIEPQRCLRSLARCCRRSVFSGAMSIAIGLSARQRFAAPSLTHWDEAVAFSGIGLLAHIGTRVFA